MSRWVALVPALLLAGCLARVESTVIPVKEPRYPLTRSAQIFEREGFLISTIDDGLVRSNWRFTERKDGDGFLYYRYVVEQKDRDTPELTFRIEVIRCSFVPREGEPWEKSGCTTMPPRVPLWAEDDYRRIEKILRASTRPAHPERSRKKTSRTDD